MSFLDEVRTKRQKLADVLTDEDYSGIREIVEDLYPDRAHFIYELLQNAEDTGATEATFELTNDSVAFEHNGRPFNEDDVMAITNIGKGTKRDQEDQIGRFGIGFKAVFAYTETPHIWSSTYSFKITDLVLPTEISEPAVLEKKTRFEFPFNNPKKPAQVAYEEIKAELEALAETTLLFLSHLTCIGWRIDAETSGCIMREQHSEHHIEVLREAEQKETSSSHFLRFSAPIEGLPTQAVSVAFPLGFLPNVQKFDPAKPISRQLKIVPTTGRVSVYFPAEKETSGLRFHLHAPFVPELSRASIKDTSANEPLFKQLAGLAAYSLYTIRDLNLLTGEFLGVLPNPQDSVPARYQPIRAAIIDAMKYRPLTPTYARSHAPAVYLRQAKASLKELLTEDDLNFLVDWKGTTLQWAIGATQKNSEQDRFLAGLGIADWDISEFAKLLVEKCIKWVTPVPAFSEWLAAKPVEWHQQMYSLLYRELPSRSPDRLEWLQLVRLSDGKYSTGNKCYFPADGIEHDLVLPRVDAGTYSSGKSVAQQTEARKFLVGIGVREVGDAERVESLLRQRYTTKPITPDIKDLERFIALVEKEPAKACLFAASYIFQLTDGRWGMPKAVFLDSPYQETGLTAYFEALGADAKKWALSKAYQNLPPEQLRKFAEAVGVQTKLEIEHQCTWNHRNRSTLQTDCNNGAKRTSTRIDEDYMISNLELLLQKRSEALSRLVWRTLCGSDKGVLKARFRPNQQHQLREEPSSLVLSLQEAPWVPQNNGDFVRPSEASRTLLPQGFPFDEGYEWLTAVHFGENERQQSEEHKKRQATARELGFSDDRKLHDGQWSAGLDPEDRQRFRTEFEQKQFEQRRQFELPQHNPHDPNRRAERVMQQAVDAPERISEMRTRSVSIGLEEVKAETEQYLREQYTNADGEMICQACQDRLPFKLDDGRYYFEKVEFLAELQNRHYQNYLALCPNHAAMYQHVNGSRDLMREMFMAMTKNELEVILAQTDTTIYFTGTHLADLRAVTAADQGDQVPG